MFRVCQWGLIFKIYKKIIDSLIQLINFFHVKLNKEFLQKYDVKKCVRSAYPKHSQTNGLCECMNATVKVI